MVDKWQVKFTDDDEDGIQTASFSSYDDAQKWIDNQEVQNRYDNVHFKVVDGPCKSSGSCTKVKIWVDDIRPAPEGYVWLKSVNEFIDYIVEHGLDNIAVFDFDHDAGSYASDGGDYIKCLDWLESVGASNIKVRIHSANWAGAARMKQIIKKNQWNEVFGILEDGYGAR